MQDITKNDRALQIMRLLMDEYLSEGQPVSSKALANNPELSLSSASIRLILAELEERGYLKAPHTSAGRIPTTQGYRLFVDSLLTIKPLEQSTVDNLQQSFTSHLNQADLLTRSSKVLANLTQFVGIATLPRQSIKKLKHIEFLPLGEKRILVILVFNEHDVYNRIIRTDQTFSTSELQQMGNYLSTHYANQGFDTIRQTLLNELQHEQQHLNHLMQAAAELAEKSLEPLAEEEHEYVIVGKSNVLNLVSDNDLSHLRSLFETFQQKRALLSVLEACTNAKDIQIFIGEESGFEHLSQYSVITAPYAIEGCYAGSLGVIGPMRMAYDAVIPTVDITAKLLTIALNH